MAEKLLDDAQVGAAVEQVGGEAVAQEVGVDGDGQAGFRRVTADDRLDGAGAEAAAEAVEEEGGHGRLDQPGAAVALVALEGGGGGGAEDADTVLLAFAADADEAVAQVEVGRVGAGDLADAEAAA